MPSLQDQDYVTATNEVGRGELETASWGRAFSDALGDPQAALALYIRFRVEQLGRERRLQNLNRLPEKLGYQFGVLLKYLIWTTVAGLLLALLLQK